MERKPQPTAGESTGHTLIAPFAYTGVHHMLLLRRVWGER